MRWALCSLTLLVSLSIGGVGYAGYSPDMSNYLQLPNGQYLRIQDKRRDSYYSDPATIIMTTGGVLYTDELADSANPGQSSTRRVANGSGKKLIQRLSEIPGFRIYLTPSSSDDEQLVYQEDPDLQKFMTFSPGTFQRPSHMGLEMASNKYTVLYGDDAISSEHFQKFALERPDATPHFTSYEDYLRKLNDPKYGALFGPNHKKLTEEEFQDQKNRNRYFFSKILTAFKLFKESPGKFSGFQEAYNSLPKGLEHFKTDEDLLEAPINYQYKWVKEQGQDLKCMGESKWLPTIEAHPLMCLNELGYKVDWINRDREQCGIYTKSGKYLVQHVADYYCQPSELSAMSQMFYQEIKPLCQGVVECIQGLDPNNKKDLLAINDVLAFLAKENRNRLELSQKLKQVGPLPMMGDSAEALSLESFDSEKYQQMVKVHSGVISYMDNMALRFANALSTCKTQHFIQKLEEVGEGTPFHTVYYQESAEIEAALKQFEKEALFTPEQLESLRGVTLGAFNGCAEYEYENYERLKSGGHSEERLQEALQRMKNTCKREAFEKLTRAAVKAYETSFTQNVQEDLPFFFSSVELLDSGACGNIFDFHVQAQTTDLPYRCFEAHKGQLYEQAGKHMNFKILSEYYDPSSVGFNVLLDPVETGNCFKERERSACIKRQVEPVILRYETMRAQQVLERRIKPDPLQYPQLRLRLQERLEGAKEVRCQVKKVLKHDTSSPDSCYSALAEELSEDFERYLQRHDVYSEAHHALLAELSPKVRTLTHNIKVFHWGKADSMKLSTVCKDLDENGERLSEEVLRRKKQQMEAHESRDRKWAPDIYRRCYDVSLNNPNALIYAQVMKGLFFDTLDENERDGNMVGRGLYAALDPNTTEEYGEILLEIEVEEGTKYLDLSGGMGSSITLTDGTLKLLEKSGCKLPTTSSDDYFGEDERNGVQVHHFRKQIFNRHPRCLRILEQVLDELDVGFLTYRYGTQTPSLCDSTASPSLAVVLFDVPVGPSHVDVYTEDRLKTLPVGTSKYQAYERLGALRSMSPLLNEKNFSKHQEYWQQNLLGCSQQHPEDEALYQRDLRGAPRVRSPEERNN